ncbi:unnamed protein product [Blepharisma stoltei]|uniref:PhoD-like phosphatase metallophosphatase domain-containing protein n=1 Tax=Blepharisma stoltei TaxID=1481888 RepID=A0AAU9JBR2_9CILI|nr:unnamed protein product [Blepharisma stoltei]
MSLVLLFTAIAAALPIDQTKEISKIAFGSCHHHNRAKNPEIFHSISQWKPDLFLWLGDAVYADILYTHFISFPNNIENWRMLYNKLKNISEYQELINTSMISGVWDDHDYGINDGDKTFSMKNESKQLFLEFLGENNSERWNHDGLYQSYTFGNNGKRIKIILIDIRWFRDNKKDTDGDSLGEEQWNWLEKELKNPGDITIIGNGLQITVQDRLGPTERWHDKSYNRLMKNLEKVPGAILLSGDVHIGEILKQNCNKYTIYEVTSSGMTHTAYTVFGYIGLFLSTFDLHFGNNVGPRIYEFNYGTLEVDWNSRTIEMAIRDSFGNILQSELITIEKLKTPIEKPSYYCGKTSFYINSTHILSMTVVFACPAFILLMALIIALRKYSHTY